VKIICTTVIRAAKQGDIHGGLYVIDIDSEEVIHYAPYEMDFVNDNERGGERGLRGICVLPDRIIVSDSAGFIELDKNTYEIKRTHQNKDYFKSIHEIAFHDDHLWVTSTAYDAIAKVDLDFNVVDFWELQGKSLENSKLLTGKKQITQEEKQEDDNYHINSVCINDGKVFVSGLLTPLYDFETMDAVCGSPSMNAHGFPSVYSFVHNFYKYDDSFIANLTSFNAIGISKEGEKFEIHKIPASKRAVYHIDSIAANNWNRGLVRYGDKIIIGSTPARIMVFDIPTRTFEKEIKLEKDMRHAIHGLEIIQ
jgi:hypothetical protein